SIDGGGGQDSIRAGDGNDTVYYRSDVATIDGGGGNDVLVLSGVSSFALASGKVRDFEILDARGTSQGISIVGSSSENTILGGNYNDTINGLGGGDSIDAGSGNDLVWYFEGAVSILGGTGTDTLNLSGVGEFNLAAAPVRSFEVFDASARTRSITIIGLSASDTVAADSLRGHNTILGGTSADSINGRGGDDSIVAGDGNDSVVYYSDSGSYFVGGSGIDHLMISDTAVSFYDAASVGSVALTAGRRVIGFEILNASERGTAATAAITIQGANTTETIIGSAVGDTIDGGGGNDSIDAGPGNDTVYYRSDVATLIGGDGVDYLNLTGVANFNYNTGKAAGFEVLDFRSRAVANVSVVGSSGAETILGATGAAYNNSIDGGGGADSIVGGAGNDTIVFYDGQSAIGSTLIGGDGIDVLKLDVLANGLFTASAASVSGFEIFSAYDRTAATSIVGSSAGETIVGSNTAADSIDGRGGNDSILALGGNDTVVYFDGASKFDGGDGVDTLMLTGITNFTLGATVANFEVFVADTAINFTGNSSAQTIMGSTRADWISGGGGEDSILAGAGSDTVTFFEGATTIDGGAGDVDVLRIVSGEYYASSGRATGFEVLNASERTGTTVILGSSQAELIYGANGGAAAADSINGGGGADTILGGSGNDTIVYSSAAYSISGGDGRDYLDISSISTTFNVGSASVGGFEWYDASARPASLGGVTIIGSTGGSIESVLGSSQGDSIDLRGGAADYVDAGSGSDSVVFNTTYGKLIGGDGANIDYLIFADSVAGGFILNTSSIQGFEILDASGLSSTKPISITGSNNEGDTIFGGAGADYLSGGASNNNGSDSIMAGEGADTIFAGLGRDVIWLGDTVPGVLSSDTLGDGAVDRVIFRLGDGGSADSIDVVYNFTLASDSVGILGDLFNLTGSANQIASAVPGFIQNGVVRGGQGDTVFTSLDNALYEIERISSGLSGDSVLSAGEFVLFKVQDSGVVAGSNVSTYIGYAGGLNDVDYVIKLVGVGVPSNYGVVETSANSDVYFIGPPPI
ncbi:MAG: calcium-binding protein, partial [Betaproteobacteria bacterium]|nr:calcium-binding protein [Betaproteobacteria bacterium]